MSIASEITRLQTSKADSKAQINIDKDIINDGIDFINNEKVDSYNEKIAEMQDAYKQYIPINSTSDTQIEAPKGGVIIGKTIKGNTTQDGTPTPSSPVPVNNVTGKQVVRVCGKNLFDGQLEAGEYDNSTGEKKSTANRYRNANFISVAPNTTYTFSIDGVSQKYVVYEYNKSKNFIRFFALESGTFTTSANTEYINFRNYAVDYTADFTSLQIQLEKGSSASDYQEYQGKDYEINLGANLLDIQSSWVNGKSQTQNGLRYVVNEDDTISISGTSTNYSGVYARNYNSTSVFMTLKANHTYRILVEVSDKTSNINSRVYFGTTNANISGFSLTSIGGNGTYYKDYTPTQDVGLTQYSIIGAESAGETSLIMKIAIYDVTTSSIDNYSPYITPIELNKIGNYQDFIKKGTGKNILLGTIETKTANNVTITKNSGNSCTITTNGTASATTFFNTNEDTLLKANTTYLIGLGNGNSDCQLSIRPSDNSMQYANTTTTSYVTYTPTEDISVRLFVRIANGKSVNETIFPYIQEGTDTPIYEPFGYKDKWYIEKNVGKVVLNGSEDGWSYPSANRFNLDDYVNDYLKKNNDVTYVCDSYIGYGQKPANSDFNTLVANVNYGFDFDSGNAFNIRIKDTRYTSIADFKSSLQTNNITLYYVLANPTYTLIDNEELIEQLNRIMQLYEGQNNILVTGDLAATLDLDYIVKAENHL